MNSFRTLILFAALLCAHTAGYAQTEAPPHVVSVGATELRLPVPAGFVEAARAMPKVRQLGETMTPPGNRLLAFFVKASGPDAGASDPASLLHRYMMVQTLRSAERTVLSKRGIEEVKAELRAQYKTVYAQLQPKIQSDLDAASQKVGAQAGRPELSVKVGEFVPLDIFDERPQSISFAALTKVTAKTALATQEVPLVIAMTTLVLDGKLLYFYAYSVYDGAADLAWVRSATTEWLAALP